MHRRPLNEVRHRVDVGDSLKPRLRLQGFRGSDSSDDLLNQALKGSRTKIPSIVGYALPCSSTGTPVPSALTAYRPVGTAQGSVVLLPPTYGQLTGNG
jgi:hypothetical protein